MNTFNFERIKTQCSPSIHRVTPECNCLFAACIYAGTYDVKYDDGDAEAFVPSSRIRARPSYTVGMAVEANFGGQGKFYSGTIAAAHSDGTYDVAYNDGDRERNVSAAMIRPGEVA